MSRLVAVWLSLAVPLAPLALATPLSTSPYHAPTRTHLSVAPLHVEDHPHGSIDNSYIVVFKEDVSPALMDNHLNFLQMAHAEDSLLGNTVADGLRHVYDGGLKGYAGEFTEGVIEQIRRMPEVDFVEMDQVVRATVFNETIVEQKGSPWGLARISHRNKLTFSTFTKYVYDDVAGEGVDAYIIDTGINTEHEQFEDRAEWGYTVPRDDTDSDENGHGTHCAGTIASTKYGVAKKARVIAVKVLGSNGSGSMSDVIAGVEWARKSALEKARQARAERAATGKSKHKGSVANMSLGGGKSAGLEIAVNRAVDQGIHFAVAAGNDDRDACKYSPAGAEKAVTVGASTLGDERAYFSNYGECVDVFAPGLNILSTYKGSPHAIATLSGTSMASPHTAGLLAYLLSIYPSATFNPMILMDAPISGWIDRYASVYAIAYTVLPRWVVAYLPPPAFLAPIPSDDVTILSPKALKHALLDLSSKGLIADVGEGSPNKLIFNNATSY
ncbi:peptidase S8/S53 domain-containing protein [Pisolithus albus]|nr:peptidase S8/S53 domain-containing protein [Pisolithus albus]